MIKITALDGLLIVAQSVVIAQSDQRSVVFIEPEAMIGYIVPNYEGHPASTVRTSYGFNLGTFKNNPARATDSYYNFPHAGVSFSYSHLGNNRQLGETVSIVPYIMINASPRLQNSWNFKFGLGASYFTRPYDAETNRRNLVIGSRLNWEFQAFLYRSLWVTERMNLRIGGGYVHSSNAHTQLPNFGLNAAMLSLSCAYYFDDVDPLMKEASAGRKIEKTRSFFLQGRTGVGFHEFGGTTGPIGEPKKLVETYAISGGMVLKGHLKLYGGFLYRFYHSFYDYMQSDETMRKGNLKWQASAINFFLGAEFLMGHVGMNAEGGLNLVKPFYREYYDLFETGNHFNYIRMRYFTTRLGLNLYLINTGKQPRNNLSIGSHINANFGKADFMDFSLRYTRRID